MVIGAAGALGRWFDDHVLAAAPWSAVTLCDTAAAIDTVAHNFAVEPTRSRVGAAGHPAAHAALARPGTTLVIAVPPPMLPAVAAWALPALHDTGRVVILTHEQVGARDVLARPAVGVHCLFGTAAERAEGQSFAVCGDDARWVCDLIEAVGGTTNVLTPEHHDAVMAYVQTAAHRALLTFADTLGQSGFDLEQDLWANRTPVFELLLALASRVLAPGQEAITASLQAADHLGAVAKASQAAQARLDAVLATGDEAAVARYVAQLRNPFSGGLFTKAQQAGVLAIGAAQAARARVAHHRQSGELLGVRTTEGRLHVGFVEDVTPTAFALRDVLVGSAKQGYALLVDDESTRNARKLGISGTAKRVEFTLGRARMLSPDELEAELDTALATVPRGCKFLVPEAIAGASALEIVRNVNEVAEAELVSEEVRLGQRECVVRFRARVDRSLSDVERMIQHRIDEVFLWPDGVVLPVGIAVRSIGYLGPAGTFSDVAARQLARLVAAPPEQRVECADFVELIDALASARVDLAVLPITSSSTGLVDLAAQALLASASTVTAGGVVDVPVRFDAYVAPGQTLTRGDTVYSHPQGLRQCSAFIQSLGLVEESCVSTTDACVKVAALGHGVALAASGVGEELGLEGARASVGNLAGALTRFLVLGRAGTFGKSPRSDVTERSVWICPAGTDLSTPNDHGEARYDEVLRGPSGQLLVVSTRPDRVASAGARYLGTVPWSPRTPIVTV